MGTGLNDSDGPLGDSTPLPLMQKQLVDLLVCLHDIAAVLPQSLVYLSEVAQPELPQESRIPVLGVMFEELSKFFTGTPATELQRALASPPSDAVSLKLLIALREVALILDELSYLQLLNLANYVPQMGASGSPFAFLTNLQELLRTWDDSDLNNLHTSISKAPLHLERKKLLAMEPNIPWEMLQLMADLLKLPLEELQNLRKLMGRLNARQLEILMRLLLLDSATLMELKRRVKVTKELGPPQGKGNPMLLASKGLDPYSDAQVALQDSEETMIDNSILDSSMLSLRIATQPARKTVYQRILRPFPSIILICHSTLPQKQPYTFFVEAALQRSDNKKTLPCQLEGTRLVRVVNGVFATFKKLKIMSTSQQLSTKFILNFSLKIYRNNAFETIPGVEVVSNTIEVFSHTLYLNRQAADDTDPTPYEIIPAEGEPGERAILLGQNFKNVSDLRVSFGDEIVSGDIHESGAIIVKIPPGSGQVEVRIGTQGKPFSEGFVTFEYLKTRNQ